MSNSKFHILTSTVIQKMLLLYFLKKATYYEYELTITYGNITR